jgi:hypothetical protein
VATEEDPTLLSLLRATPEVPPSEIALLNKTLQEMNNHLDDIKLKLGIRNEIALELLELRKKEGRSDVGAQARPYRNIPPSSWRR